MQATESTNASGPIERIDQVRRFDVIKLLEQDSTRLFHRGDKTHAADLAQAALFLRQEPEAIIGRIDRAGLIRRAEEDFAKEVRARLASCGIDMERDDAPIQAPELEFIWRRVSEHLTSLLNKIAQKDDLLNIKTSRLLDLETRLAHRRIARSSKKRKGRK